MLFHTSLILLMNKIFWNTSTCNTEKKIQSYEFAKNQGTNFDKLQGFQVPLISPNALLTDLYIVQSATKYFINFIIYIYLYMTAISCYFNLRLMMEEFDLCVESISLIFIQVLIRQL